MNQQEKAERFTELMTRFTSVLGKILPDDVATRLAELRKEQTSDISRIVYDAMFDDLAAARRLFDGLVITMLVCAVLFTLSNNFFLGCAVILLGLAATAFHFAVLRCPHCGRHLGRERGNTCPHCGRSLTEE